MKFRKADNSSDSGDEALSEINIIPLVDIMLVLLIIFMVAAPMMKEGVDINLPDVSAKGIDAGQDEFILSIDADGRIFINDNKTDKFSLVSIGDKLKEVFQTRAKKELYLKADKTVQYGYVVSVMAACQAAGIDKVGMITSPPDEETTATVNP